MYLDIRFYLKCLTFSYLFESSHQRYSVEVSVLECFVGFAGELLYRGLFFSRVAGLWLAVLLKGRLQRGCYSCGFCKIFGRVLFTEHLQMNVSVCSFYNLKSFICDILQIYKLKKNISLDIILYTTCIQFCVFMFYFRIGLVNLIKSNKKIIIKKKKKKS